MPTLTEACNIFKVLDDENKGYITVDRFVTSFHNFYKNIDNEDRSSHENTLKSLISQMQPDEQGRIYIDNFLLVFQKIEPEQNVNLKSRTYSQYSIKRFLSAESFELPVADQDDVNNYSSTSKDQNHDNLAAKNEIKGQESNHDNRSFTLDNRLSNSGNLKFPEFDDITNHSTWPKRRLRIASSCKNLLENQMLFPSAASRIRDLVSAGASPRGSDIYPGGALSQDIINNFDVLQMEMKRLEQKLSDFHLDQFDLDKQQSQRLKEEKKSLVQRINNLEDNLRELEEKGQSRIDQEKREFKQKILRTEEDKSLEFQSMENRLFKLEKESADFSLEIRRYRDESDSLKVEKHEFTERLTESDMRIINLQEEFERVKQISQSDKEGIIKDKENYEKIMTELNEKSNHIYVQPDIRIKTMNKINQRHKELEELVEKLREENKQLSNQIEDSNRELMERKTKGEMNYLNSSDDIAKELEDCSKDKLMDMLAKDKDSNFRLRDYIEKIIVKVMEKHPSILEVRSNKK